MTTETEFPNHCPAGHWAGKQAGMEGATLPWTAPMVGKSVLQLFLNEARVPQPRKPETPVISAVFPN